MASIDTDNGMKGNGEDDGYSPDTVDSDGLNAVQLIRMKVRVFRATQRQRGLR